MNVTYASGLLAALVIFCTALFTSTTHWEIFLNHHGILIVLGGTVAASLICFPMKSLLNLFKIFFRNIVGKNRGQHESLISEIVDLARGLRNNPNHLQSESGNIRHAFLKEAIELMASGGIRPQDLDLILKKRASTMSKRYEEEAGIFKTLSKFPPAFGLMGTTLAMIGLMQSLGAADSFKLIGPAMAMGLVATLYGIALSNLILIPIGERLLKINRDDEIIRNMVIDGVKLLRSREHPVVVEEFLKSYLLPSERAQIRSRAA